MKHHPAASAAVKEPTEMTWLGTFAFGASIAAYHGRAATNTMHAHASIQLTVPRRGNARIADAHGAEVAGPGLLTRPGQRHRLAPIDEVTLIFIEPHAPLAAALLEQAGDAGTSHLPDALIDSIRQAATPSACIDCLQAATPRTTPELEPRLAQALTWLAHPTHPGSIADAAAHCGLSDSRLRTLARQHLGAPLSAWLAWRKLERAGKALMTGATLADAAMAAGFADQAHFSRTMRKVFGITPGSAAPIMRRQHR